MIEILVVAGFGLLCWGIARAPQQVTQALLALAWISMAVFAIGSITAALLGY